MAEHLNAPDRTLFIGDNLPVLRGINTDSVDLVYLDPPRNRGKTQTGRKYNGELITYEDTWTIEDMRAEWLDEIGVRCPDALLAINGAKVLHSAEMADYLTFMTVRLLELAPGAEAVGQHIPAVRPEDRPLSSGGHGCGVRQRELQE